MSTVETADGGTRRSRGSLTREPSQDTAAASGRSAPLHYILQVVALLSVIATPLTALTESVLGQLQAAKQAVATVPTMREVESMDQPVVTQAAFVQAIKRLAGAALGFVVVILLMIQLWQMDMVQSANGEWANLLSQIKTILMAAFSLIALALFAYAASIAMSALNIGGGGGGR